MASRKWSTVWLYYQRGEDANKVVCLICLEAIQHYGNTSNLLRHLRSKHRAEYADVEKKRQVDVAGGTGTPQHRAMKALAQGVNGGSQSEMLECTAGGNGTEQVQLKREMDRSGTANGVHNGAPCSSLMKPRKQSTLWEFYQDGHDGSEALCLLCSDTVLYQHDTRHLLTHLQKRHPVEFSNLDNEAATEQSSGPMRHCSLKRPALQEEACGNPGRDPDILEVLMVGETEQDHIRKALEQEARMLERERELTAQLRRAQEQEARALERERELTEQLRKARDQERKAAQEQEDRALEREHKLMEQLRREHEQEMRRVQELEARVLERERRAIEQLGMALEQEARAIQREREALEQLRRELEQDRRALQRQREEVGRSTDASDANLDVQHHEEQSV
ncbi:myosin-6 [Scleropages formosus]|uniref:myosin-6 n=1 Tax=Scleropages formosus TaxID=113540 RepID=UPI0008789EBF|nr:myosin-6-like [Scleropages formosus]